MGVLPSIAERRKANRKGGRPEENHASREQLIRVSITGIGVAVDCELACPSFSFCFCGKTSDLFSAACPPAGCGGAMPCDRGPSRYGSSDAESESKRRKNSLSFASLSCARVQIWSTLLTIPGLGT